jgi:hypothetical protein
MIVALLPWLKADARLSIYTPTIQAVVHSNRQIPASFTYDTDAPLLYGAACLARRAIGAPSRNP